MSKEIFDKHFEYVNKMDKGGEVKVGDILTDKNRVKFKVVEFDPRFGGQVRVLRLDEYGDETPSDFMPLSKYKTAKGNAKKKVQPLTGVLFSTHICP